MKLPLTTEQAAAVGPLLRHGWTMLAKIERESFDGTNAETCGRLWLELGSVPTSSLPSLRAAIRQAATAPVTAPRRKRKAKA